MRAEKRSIRDPLSVNVVKHETKMCFVTADTIKHLKNYYNLYLIIPEVIKTPVEAAAH